MEAQRFLFERNYDAALKVFQDMEREHPESPTGAFGQMAVWQLRMFENLDFRFRAEYEEAQRRFEKIVDEFSKMRTVEAWDLLIAGAGLGMRGFFFLRDGKWFRAFGSAIRAVRFLRQAAWQDPNFIDPRLGIGMYDYWRSVLTTELYFLPFFGDRRKEGIEAVKLVMARGQYTIDLAKANLATIYIEERRYNEAITLLDNLLDTYPQNIILRQFKARAYMVQRSYDLAIKEHRQVLEIDPGITKSWFFIGYAAAQRAGTRDTAIEALEKYLGTSPEKKWEANTHSWLGRIFELKGDRIRAKEEYEKAVELDPELRTARDGLKRVTGP